MSFCSWADCGKSSKLIINIPLQSLITNTARHGTVNDVYWGCQNKHTCQNITVLKDGAGNSIPTTWKNIHQFSERKNTVVLNVNCIWVVRFRPFNTLLLWERRIEQRHSCAIQHNSQWLVSHGLSVSKFLRKSRTCSLE